MTKNNGGSGPPYVVSINAVSGGGKTALAKTVGAQFSAAVFSFDDFDDTNIHPESMYDWWRHGADVNEFQCPGLLHAVHEERDSRDTGYLVLDFPFGRRHSGFRELSDLSVFINTPLDVAMARRLIRDYASGETDNASSALARLQAELTGYLDRARHCYLEAYLHLSEDWKEILLPILDQSSSAARLRE